MLLIIFIVQLNSVVNVTSYHSLKFGVRGLTQSLACELGPHNITVNAIAPGSDKMDMYYAAPPNVIKIMAEKRCERKLRVKKETNKINLDTF